MAVNTRSKYTRAIWQITEALRNTKELDTALSKSLEIIISEIGCEAGSVWFLNKDDNRVQAAFNVGTESIAGVTVANGQGIVGTVTKSGESVIVRDTSKDSRFTNKVDDKTGFVTKSIICVPLSDGYETIGAIEVMNKKGTGFFDTEDLALCEEMASIAAIIIEDRGFAFSVAKKGKKIVELKNIKKNFRVAGGAIAVLRGINLEIYENELLVILGESGCGKSTLMNIIGGTEHASEGTLIVEGQDYSNANDKTLTSYRRDYIGFVFQSNDLMPNLNSKQNIEFVSEASRDHMSSSEALAMVGLSDKARSYPSQLSGGQRQRVSIARAIAKKPKLILADEPTESLDYKTAVEVLSVFENIIRQKKTTVVMITHNAHIAKMANRVIQIKDGQIASVKVNMHPVSASEVEW